MLGEVEVREDVAVQDEEAVGEEALVGGEADRPRGAERLGLLDVAHAGPARDLVAERRAQVLGRKPQAMTTSVTPWRPSQSAMKRMNGRSTSGIAGLGCVRVSG